METIDHIKLYNQIPNGYKGEVTKNLPYPRNVISRWKNNHEIDPDRRKLVNLEVAKYWSFHNLAETMVVEIEDELVATHLKGKSYIDYTKLMDFKIKEDDCIHDVYDIHTLIGSARECIENLNSKEPYKTQLLIAKYILR